PTVFSEIRYLHGVEMPGEQDLRRSWLAPVDGHASPPLLSPGHLSPEKMTMSAGENSVPNLVGDVRAALLRVITVHEFGEVGELDGLLYGVDDVEVVGVGKRPILQPGGLPVVARCGGHDHPWRYLHRALDSP